MGSQMTDLGTLKVIDADNRGTAWDFSDTSITTTWEEADLSALGPQGAKAVWAYLYTTNTGNDIRLALRGGSQSSNDDFQTGAWSNLWADGGTNRHTETRIVELEAGKFDYRAMNGSANLENLYLMIRGWLL
jgi:hypothetical protein